MDHDREAAARLPGPDYYEVLRWLHEELRPAVYTEIGVSYGESLKLAMPPTVALGIDPRPLADHPWKTVTRIAEMTSGEFFARHTLREWAGADRFSLAFIDGLHLFEEAVADLYRLEPYAAPNSVVALHDTIPLDRATAARVRATEFHTGDVWKVLPYLRECRPDLDVVTVAAAPSGLTLIRGLGAAPQPKQADLLRFRDLPWEEYEAPRALANERAAVAAWLWRA